MSASRLRLKPINASKARVKTIILFLFALCVSSCSTIFSGNGEDPQAVVDKRVIGMSVGDFFQRYGAPTSRDESRDGTLGFNWESSLTTKAAAGPIGLEGLVCRLRVSADRSGRIVAAPILRDGKGQRRLSRCAELFAPS